MCLYHNNSITLLYYYAGSGEQHRILETKRNKLVKFRATVSDSILGLVLGLGLAVCYVGKNAFLVC